MDILALLRNDEVSSEHAQAIFDEHQRRFHANEIAIGWHEYFQLSRYEATAYLHGATLDELTKLRYDGWPIHCCKCRGSLDYTKYGWWFAGSINGVPILRHIECPLMSVTPPTI
jgi:hypothetical protein